jgi:hypothetical protein
MLGFPETNMVCLIWECVDAGALGNFKEKVEVQ